MTIYKYDTGYYKVITDEGKVLYAFTDNYSIIPKGEDLSPNNLKMIKKGKLEWEMNRNDYKEE